MASACTSPSALILISPTSTAPGRASRKAPCQRRTRTRMRPAIPVSMKAGANEGQINNPRLDASTRRDLLLAGVLIATWQGTAARADDLAPQLPGPFADLATLEASTSAEDRAREEGEVLGLVRVAVRKELGKSKAPGALRLPFHDAFTFNPSTGAGGMNGSILYELERPENNGLKRIVKALAKAKEKLEPTTTISWADLIAVGGSEAVALCGGPLIPVRLGRIDVGGPDAEGELPAETLPASALKAAFSAKTFTTQELVALSGAHTIGGKGFGDPTTFDNAYYEILLAKPWSNPREEMGSMIGLPTDRSISADEECLEWIEIYAKDQERFFLDFSKVYTKLVGLGAQWSIL